MNILDWIFVVLATFSVILGWRAGLVRGLFGFAGFLAGLVAGVMLVPNVVDQWSLSTTSRSLIVVASVLTAAIFGQLLGGWAGGVLRSRITWRPAETVDSLGGAGLALVGFAMMLWVLATAVLWLPTNPATDSFSASRVVDSLDARVPGVAKQALYDAESRFQDATLPVIVGGFYTPPASTPPPATSDAMTPAVQDVLDSVVRVSGNKPSCGSGATGSGYVSTYEHVTTNAHVVAGMDRPRVTTSTGDSYRAEVVAMDTGVDVAVLYVPGLPLEPVPTSTDAHTDTEGAVAGYPGGGELAVSGVVIRAELSGRQTVGDDIYGNPGVPREVFVMTATVVPGNSGGPVLGMDGKVIGLVFAQALEDSNVGYALTAEQFRTLSREYGSATTPINTGDCPAG